jgi:putative cardiolipin synthase
MSMHTKAMVVDRKRVFIGSMNLDPRSYQINSEMGIVIESPDLSKKLAGIMERGISPENSWRIEIDPEGDLRWVSGSQILTRQPARSFMQRVKDVFFMLSPKDLY